MESCSKIFMLVLLQLFGTLNAVDWCSDELKCRTEKAAIHGNTMCIYKDQMSTEECKNIIDKQSEFKRGQLVDAHNNFRGKIATGAIDGFPQAARMKKMSYDTTLERMAFRWATQCLGGHDRCRKTPEWSNVGQNVWDVSSNVVEKLDGDQLVSYWSDKIQDVKNATNGYKYDDQTASAAQLIYEATEKIGCTDVEYEKTKDGVAEKRRRIICNYAPGMSPKTTLYEEGPVCSKCKNNDTCVCSAGKKNFAIKLMGDVGTAAENQNQTGQNVSNPNAASFLAPSVIALVGCVLL